MRARLPRSLATLLLLAAPLRAQASDTARTAAPGLFTTRDAVIAGATVAGTLALIPLDRRIATHVQRPSLQHDATLRHLATTARLAALPGTVIAAPVLWGVGRLTHHSRLADLGLHAGEAIVVAEGAGLVIKGIAGRARPYVVGDTLPRSFRLGRGFRGDKYASFPSGHTLAGFAFAGAVTAETAHWWPRATWYVAPLAYGSATLMGLSRVYHDEHWASDVALGAGLGTLSGLLVVRYNHAQPRNAIDRWLLATTVTPTSDGGVVVAWRMSWR